MKTLYLLRHAKSSWKNPELDDFDRPLNARGKRDAPFMGKLLAQKSVLPDLIISSSAKRTRKTAQKVAQEIEYLQHEIMYNSKLYHASTTQMLAIIRQQPDRIQRLMLVGHNPSMTNLINMLILFTDTFIENVPTSGFCEIHFDNKAWENISADSAHLVAFEYPKKYASV